MALDERKEICGLTIYPIKVRYYERYISAKRALQQRQKFLPVKYLFMPFLSAVFSFCLDPLSQDTEFTPKGAFFGILDALILAGRLDTTPSELVRKYTEFTVENNALKLLRIRLSQGEKKIEITPDNFGAIRQGIAEMNGFELPDESKNAEIIRSAIELQKYNTRNAKKLKPDFADLIETVAYKSNLLYEDILEWNVKDFERRKRAIDRVESYEIYAQAEMSGLVSFKKGNPCPSLYFDVIDDTYGTTDFKGAHLTGLQPKN